MRIENPQDPPIDFGGCAVGVGQVYLMAQWDTPAHLEHGTQHHRIAVMDNSVGTASDPYEDLCKLCICHPAGKVKSNEYDKRSLLSSTAAL